VGGGYNSYVGKSGLFADFGTEVQFGKNVRLGYFYSTRQAEQIYTSYSGPKGIHEFMLKFIPNPERFSEILIRLNHWKSFFS
jgi:hypothetical protein